MNNPNEDNVNSDFKFDRVYSENELLEMYKKEGFREIIDFIKSDEGQRLLSKLKEI